MTRAMVLTILVFAATGAAAAQGFDQEERVRYSLSTQTMLPPAVVAINPRISLNDKRVGRTLGPLRVVQLNILVQADGTARDVKLVRTSGYDGYDTEAMRAARRATYLPGLDRGMAVEAAMDYEVSFGLLCNRPAGNWTCDYGRFPTTCSATVCAKLLN